MPPPVELTILLLLLTAGAFAGGVLPLLTRWPRERLSLLLCFGSGVLLGVIFLEMLPTVLQITGAWGGLSVLGGFLFTSLLETALHAHRHSGGHADGAPAPGPDAGFRGRSLATAGLTVSVGLSLHSLMDGLALGTGMTLPGVGPALFFAVLLHKAPDAFALSTVMLVAGRPPRRILEVQGLFSLATPAGALLAVSLLRGLPPPVVGVAVGAAAGTLLGVATEDLLPEVHRRGREGFLGAALSLLAGIALVASYRISFQAS